MKPASVGKVAVGHPVDVASGTLFHDFEDYVVQGACRWSSPATTAPGC